jgi:hypothetical protein
MNDSDGPHRPPDEPNALPVAPGHPQETKESGAGKPGTARAKFSLRKVLTVVVPVAVLAVVTVALVGFIDTDVLLDNLTRPALVSAGGQVLFQGQPLRNGQIMTSPTGARGASAMGWTDDEGKFALKTDIRGSYVEGATVGEHRVTVIAYGSSPGASAPPVLTPQQYASIGTSPLRITVGKNSSENQFKLVLEGDPSSRPSRPTKSKQDSPDEQ